MRGPKAHMQTIHSIKAAHISNDIPDGSKEKKQSVRKLPNFLPLAPQRQHNRPENPVDKILNITFHHNVAAVSQAFESFFEKAIGEESRFFSGINKSKQHWGKAREVKHCISKACHRSENKISKHKGAKRMAWGSFCSPS